MYDPLRTKAQDKSRWEDKVDRARAHWRSALQALDEAIAALCAVDASLRDANATGEGALYFDRLARQAQILRDRVESTCPLCGCAPAFCLCHAIGDGEDADDWDTDGHPANDPDYDWGAYREPRAE